MSTPMTQDERARLEVMLRNMQRAVAQFYYGWAFPIGCHPFIEFCGLMHVFVQMADQSLKAGIDFSQATAHTGQALIAHDYQVEYLAEKFSCIFGPVFDDPKLAADFICRVMARTSPKSAPTVVFDRALAQQPLELNPADVPGFLEKLGLYRREQSLVHDVTMRCPRPCSECDGGHHRIEGSDRCKHCETVLDQVDPG